MDTLVQALFSPAAVQADVIPPEYDWFAPLLGDWVFDYYDRQDQPVPRHIRGEWMFRRALKGAGILDLFIAPSRETRQKDFQPDAEYGVAIRMFHPQKRCYDMVYTCRGKMRRLEFVWENGALVGTVLEDPTNRWIFAEISENNFHWQNVTLLPGGGRRVNSNLYATRRQAR